MKSIKKKAVQTATPMPATEPASAVHPDTEHLIGKAHRVLVHYRPNATLPTELKRVRAMLDTHMFGRDAREVRDDAVETARQIDRILPAKGR